MAPFLPFFQHNKHLHHKDPALCSMHSPTPAGTGLSPLPSLLPNTPRCWDVSSPLGLNCTNLLRGWMCCCLPWAAEDPEARPMLSHRDRVLGLLCRGAVASGLNDTQRSQLESAV